MYEAPPTHTSNSTQHSNCEDTLEAAVMRTHRVLSCLMESPYSFTVTKVDLWAELRWVCFHCSALDGVFGEA